MEQIKMNVKRLTAFSLLFNFKMLSYSSLLRFLLVMSRLGLGPLLKDWRLSQKGSCSPRVGTVCTAGVYTKSYRDKLKAYHKSVDYTLSRGCFRILPSGDTVLLLAGLQNCSFSVSCTGVDGTAKSVKSSNICFKVSLSQIWTHSMWGSNEKEGEEVIWSIN